MFGSRDLAVEITPMNTQRSLKEIQEDMEVVLNQYRQLESTSQVREVLERVKKEVQLLEMQEQVELHYRGLQSRLESCQNIVAAVRSGVRPFGCPVEIPLAQVLKSQEELQERLLKNLEESDKPVDDPDRPTKIESLRQLLKPLARRHNELEGIEP